MHVSLTLNFASGYLSVLQRSLSQNPFFLPHPWSSCSAPVRLPCPCHYGYRRPSISRTRRSPFLTCSLAHHPTSPCSVKPLINRPKPRSSTARPSLARRPAGIQQEKRVLRIHPRHLGRVRLVCDFRCPPSVATGSERALCCRHCSRVLQN
jgi:hypothetical protein